MKLCTLLTERAVLPELTSEDKQEVLAEFAAHAASLNPQLGKDTVYNILMNREQLGSTAVGNGVAIPHGKLTGLTDITAIFGRSLKGIDFDSHDGKPTHLFFVLLAPESAVGNHLQALARLSRLLKDAKVREKLITSSPEELYAYLIAEDEKI